MRNPTPWRNRLSALAIAGVVLGSAAAVLADYPTHVQSLSPLGYWRLNEAGPVPSPVVLKNLGSLAPADDGAPVGSAQLGAPGFLTGSTAMRVAGGACANVAYDPVLNPATFSAEGWFKPDSVTSSLVCCMSQFVEGTRTGWLVYMSSAGWNFRTYYANGTAFSMSITGGGAPVANQWYHIVVTFDSGTLEGKIYVNGAVTSGTASAYIPNNGNPFAVGRRADNAFGWPGTAGEAAIYSTVLTATQVNAHYTAGGAGDATAYRTAVLADAPLGYWRLNEAAYVPLVAVNGGSSGAANNGTYMSTGTASAAAGPSSPTFAGFAADNKCASFDGNTGYIDLPPLGITTDRLTMVAWVKTGTLGSWDGIVMSRDVNNKATGIDVQNSAGLLALNWEDTEWGWDYNPELPTCPAGEWAFVAFAADPTTDAIYVSDPNNLSGYAVNGMNKKVFTPVVNTVKTLNGTFAIGRDPGSFGTGRCYGGEIDEVAVFNRTLTEGEILTLYYAATGTNPPIILAQPVAPDGTIYSGNSFTLRVDAAGTPNLNYQWRVNGSPIPGATQASYTKTSATTANSGSYDVVVSNLFGTAISSPVTITVSAVAAPEITSAMSPAAATRVPGGSITWSVTAIGSSPFTFIWKKGATVVATHTGTLGTDTYTKSGLAAADAGSYSVTVTNVAGSRDGGSATLSVLSSSLPGAAGAIIALGPYAWYPLDEATPGAPVADLVAGRDGTSVAFNPVDGPRPPAAAGFGAGNNAYEFTGNGSGQEVAVPAMNFPAHDVSIACWVYRNGGQVDYSGIVYCRGNGTSAGLSVTSDSRPVVTWDDQWYEWGKAPLGTAELPDNAWAFLAMVVESNQYTLYMDDGNGIKSGSFSTQWTTDTGMPAYRTKTNTFAAPVKFGRDGTSGSRIFAGRIDDVVLFNKALTPAQVKSIADAGWSAMTTSPRIGVQPTGTNYYAGAQVKLSVGASGSSTLTYQWYKGASAVPGATQATLVIKKATVADSGSYTVVIANSLGNVTSQPAVVTVSAIPSGATGYQRVIFGDQPVVYYPMDDANGSLSLAEVCNSTVDDAVINGWPVFEQTGATPQTGKSILFDPLTYGATYAVIGDPFALNQPGPLSCEAWINPTDVRSGTFGNIITKGYGGYYNGEQQLRVASGQYGFGSYSDATGGDGLNYSFPTGDLGTWVHLVGVYDGKAYRLYRNGVQVAVSNDDFRFDHVTPEWAIGSGTANGTSRAFYGGIDEVALYDYALTPYKVANHYHYATTGQVLPPTVSISRSADAVVITWFGNELQSADEATGPWTTVDTTASPLTVSPTGAKKFYRAH